MILEVTHREDSGYETREIGKIGVVGEDCGIMQPA
jgi:hypothetical protein